MPWNTDGKHCINRYKLLIATFGMADRARAATSGAEEEFGGKDQLLSDICSAIDDAHERTIRRLASTCCRNESTNAGDLIAEEDAEVENNAQ
jgi:hypothetical protein